ncbi:MAG TPA: protein kinase [Pyrinomonadaceae bacterium]|jgi:serine/threonine protein kinase
MLAPDTLLENRYLVVRPIGKGGMGAVYLAKDQRLRSTVALKETFFEDEHLRKAFEREAALLANLRHPALPRVIDHFNEDQGQFLVMEFIGGEDLEAMFKSRQGAFSQKEVLGWADQLLDALDYLHTQEPPIIHRDIKPQNLKLTSRGQIILLDFGLAKGSAGEMSQVAGTGSILGYTPTYAPLEQIHGTGTDPRSDLYSLSATLYHLLTGATPPDALSRASAVIGGQPDPLRPAHEINPQVSPAVSAALAHAMALHSEQRPATASEMRRELSEASLTPVISGSSDMATVIVPQSEASSALNQSTQVQEAAVTVIDAPVDFRPQEVRSPSARRRPEADSASRKTTPMQRDEVTPVVSGQPARRSSRMPLFIGGVVALLVAGIVIALIAASNSGASDPGSNKAPGTPASNVNSQTKQQATPQPVQKSETSSGNTASQPAKPAPTQQERKPATPVRDAIKERVKARRGY